MTFEIPGLDLDLLVLLIAVPRPVLRLVKEKNARNDTVDSDGLAKDDAEGWSHNFHLRNQVLSGHARRFD